MKVRDMTRKLVSLGCISTRQNGSHQIWKTPQGNMISIVCNHQNAEVSPIVLKNTRRTLESEGLVLC